MSTLTMTYRVLETLVCKYIVVLHNTHWTSFRYWTLSYNQQMCKYTATNDTALRYMRLTKKPYLVLQVVQVTRESVSILKSHANPYQYDQYYKSHGNPYQYYKSHGHPYQCYKFCTTSAHAKKTRRSYDNSCVTMVPNCTGCKNHLFVAFGILKTQENRQDIFWYSIHVEG